ncbi:chemotaxis protein CheB [Taibaiella lutea]|uniref:protein-glutamate methylesterase n=1 Tax=Taibaiella lutea TaxID=2608001 RepID=A0A5M6CGA9_9BACT|nr:chemotaxis protein CheB [Taibaiella lutea]KAA5532159.1 chemotaxis protein CheB [Taibaiella lutea]
MEKDDLKKATKCVVIGGSAGSIKPLLQILSKLKASLDFPVIVILHRKNDPRSSLETLLNNGCALPVKEGEDKETLKNGIVYVAPSDYHLLIENDHSLSLDASEKVLWSRPSIDVTFLSAAEVYKKNLLGILLSGANNDGSVGLERIKNMGGKTVVQSPDNAEMPAMPLSAINIFKPDYVLKDSEIAAVINRFK